MQYNATHACLNMIAMHLLNCRWQHVWRKQWTQMVLGVEGRVKGWIQQWLEGRKQRVVINSR